MRPSRSKCKCIVSDIVKKSNECDQVISGQRNVSFKSDKFVDLFLTGRETCCRGEMGKRNHAHLHLIWLSRSQNHLVPVLWDTAHVSITAQKK